MPPGSLVDRTWHLNRWQSLLFTLAALAIALAGFLAWREARAAATAVSWVQHSFGVLLQIDRLMAAITDTESGQRGYLLTGDAAYLEPYQKGAPRIGPALDALEATTVDNPDIQARLERLEPLVNQKLTEM